MDLTINRYRLKELKEGYQLMYWPAKVPTDPVDESGKPYQRRQGRDVKAEQ